MNFIKEFATQIEVGGILLAILEILGFGGIIERMIIFQEHQISLFVNWMEESTEIPLIGRFMNNFDYFYIMSTLIGGYYLYVHWSVAGVVLPDFYWLYAIGSMVVYYLLLRKVVIPVFLWVLRIYSMVIGFLTNKGAMALLGLVITLTAFAVQQATGNNAAAGKATPVEQAAPTGK